MKVNPRVIAPAGLFVGIGTLFHLFPSFFKKPEYEKPKTLGDITNSTVSPSK